MVARLSTVWQVPTTVRNSVPFTVSRQIPYFPFPVFPAGTLIVIEFPMLADALAVALTPYCPEMLASFTLPETLTDPEKVAETEPDTVDVKVTLAGFVVLFLLLWIGPIWCIASAPRLLEKYFHPLVQARVEISPGSAAEVAGTFASDPVGMTSSACAAMPPPRRRVDASSRPEQAAPTRFVHVIVFM